MTAHRFQPPWSSEEHAAYFVVRDNTGQALTYIYYENHAARRSAAKLLTKDDARRIAANIAKLPEKKTNKGERLVADDL
jgi:endo-1,4-beta-D-glucanase Y